MAPTICQNWLTCLKGFFCQKAQHFVLFELSDFVQILVASEKWVHCLFLFALVLGKMYLSHAQL